MNTKLSLLLIIVITLFTCKNANAQGWQWAKSTGGSSGDVATSVATDAFGYTYVVGSFGSTSITLGTTLLTNNGSYGTGDIYLAKYDTYGNVIWAKSAGGSVTDGATSVATDTAGNIYITGYFSSPTITFGSIILTNAGYTDVFVVKYDSSGNVIWAKGAGGINDDEATSVKTDVAGNVYISGSFFSHTISFDTISLTKSTGNCGIFTVKYNSTGSVIWAKSAYGNGYNYAYSLATDLLGNVFVTGYFQSDSLLFGTVKLYSSGTLPSFELSPNMFLAKYDSSGNLAWAKRAGTGNYFTESKSVATDNFGNIYIAGYYIGLYVAFDSVLLIPADSMSNEYVFVVKYDQAGNAIWAKSARTENYNGASYSLTTDIAGNIYLTGDFRNPNLVFGTTTLINDSVGGNQSRFLVKYDSSGYPILAKSGSGIFNPNYNAVSVDANGNVYTVGCFNSSTISIGTTILTNDSGITNSVMFIAKYNQLTLGGENIKNVMQLHLYPNPATNQLRLSFSEPIVNTTIKISDMLGRQVLNQNLSTNNKDITINLPDLPNGMYFLQATGNNLAECMQFIVNK